MKAIILAAGRGERMRPLTDTVPKPLLPVRGKPLIEWHLEALARDGIREVVINTAWLEDRIVDALGDGARFGLSIRYSLEGRDFGAALETAGGIATALPMLLSPFAGTAPGVRSAVDPSGAGTQASSAVHGDEGPGQAASEAFWVVSGDIFMPGFTFDASTAERFVASERHAHLWLVPNPPYHPKGDFALEADGTAAAGVTSAEGMRWTYANIALMRPALLDGVVSGRRAALGPVLFDAARRGRISAQVYAGEWHNVGTPEQLASLQSLL
jgi:MurNAc alpha-1-phosphate uridylyltransferase